MKGTIGIAAAITALAVSGAYADRGSIPFKQGVRVFEPTQRAMVAWNGEEEILLLSTDLSASESTMVLEVLPLPSEPEVKKGDIQVFVRATEIINRKLAEAGLKRRGSKHLGALGKKEPAGEVTFHEKIGSHDISVTHVLDRAGFLTWVSDYLDSAGVENPAVPEPLKEVVEEYMKEGCGWFVFDVVSLDEKPKTSEVVQYRFKTDHLYYPLKITRTETGFTEINLLILTTYLLGFFPGHSHREITLPHDPVSLSDMELWGLSREMYELLGEPEESKLRIWQIKGDLASFQKDLLAR
jgi:hypothetical protein